jgi:hypothetical protein
MSSNDSNKAIHTAASVGHTRRGVTPPVFTATGAETQLNNPNRPSTRASQKLTIYVDATTAEVTTTTHRKKATPALEHPATVDGAKNKETPTLMQQICPPEVKCSQLPLLRSPKHCRSSRILQYLKHDSMVPLMLHLLYHGSRRLQRLIHCSMPLNHP